MDKNKKENVILDKSFDFALKIIGLSSELSEMRLYRFSDQVFGAGTSIGANAEEANASISRKEFHAKMGIAAKEAREIIYWLRLLEASHLQLKTDVKSLREEASELKRILTSIVKTTRQNIDR